MVNHVTISYALGIIPDLWNLYAPLSGLYGSDNRIIQRVWEPLLKLRVKFERFESGRFNDEGSKRYKCLWVRFMELPAPLSRFATSSRSGRSGSSLSLDDDRFFDGLTPGRRSH